MMRRFYDNMIRSRTETLEDNSMGLLQKPTTNSIVVNVQGSESSVSPFQKALAKKVHCIQQRDIDMIEITSTQIDEFTTPAPVTLSNECQEVCPEASFLLQDACP